MKISCPHCENVFIEKNNGTYFCTKCGKKWKENKNNFTENIDYKEKYEELVNIIRWYSLVDQDYYGGEAPCRAITIEIPESEDGIINESFFIINDIINEEEEK